MRGSALALLAAALAAGCVTRRVEGPPRIPGAAAPAPDAAAGVAAGDGDPIDAMASLPLRIECDRARIVVPERLRAELQDRQRHPYPPYLVSVRNLTVEIREDRPVVEVGGEDFSVVAEGGVRTVRRDGGASVEEGPFEAVLLRNGRLLRR